MYIHFVNGRHLKNQLAEWATVLKQLKLLYLLLLLVKFLAVLYSYSLQIRMFQVFGGERESYSVLFFDLVFPPRSILSQGNQIFIFTFYGILSRSYV